MKKLVCVLSAILLTVGSFANVGIASTEKNVEIVSSELLYDEFDNCYTITTYRTCWTDNTGTYCWEDYDIEEVPCSGNQK